MLAVRANLIRILDKKGKPRAGQSYWTFGPMSKNRMRASWKLAYVCCRKGCILLRFGGEAKKNSERIRGWKRWKGGKEGFERRKRKEELEFEKCCSVLRDYSLTKVLVQDSAAWFSLRIKSTLYLTNSSDMKDCKYFIGDLLLKKSPLRWRTAGHRSGLLDSQCRLSASLPK